MDTGFSRPAPQGLLRSRGHCVTGITAQRQYDALRAFWDRLTVLSLAKHTNDFLEMVQHHIGLFKMKKVAKRTNYKYRVFTILFGQFA